MTKNLNQLLKQAQQMQQKMTILQKELETREMEISSGGGMVKIKINGKQQILGLKINKECVDVNDMGTLEDLLKTSINQADKDSQEMVRQAMSKVTAGMSIPGLF